MWHCVGRCTVETGILEVARSLGVKMSSGDADGRALHSRDCVSGIRAAMCLEDRVFFLASGSIGYCYTVHCRNPFLFLDLSSFD